MHWFFITNGSLPELSSGWRFWRLENLALKCRTRKERSICSTILRCRAYHARDLVRLSIFHTEIWSAIGRSSIFRPWNLVRRWQVLHFPHLEFGSTVDMSYISPKLCPPSVGRRRFLPPVKFRPPFLAQNRPVTQFQRPILKHDYLYWCRVATCFKSDCFRFDSFFLLSWVELS